MRHAKAFFFAIKLSVVVLLYKNLYIIFLHTVEMEKHMKYINCCLYYCCINILRRDSDQFFWHNNPRNEYFKAKKLKKSARGKIFIVEVIFFYFNMISLYWVTIFPKLLDITGGYLSRQTFGAIILFEILNIFLITIDYFQLKVFSRVKQEKIKYLLIIFIKINIKKEKKIKTRSS